MYASNKKKKEKTLDPRKNSEIQKEAGKASRQSSTSPTIFLFILRVHTHAHIYMYIRGEKNRDRVKEFRTGV